MDIIHRLNALANYEHDDLSIGHEAAETIIDFRAQVAALQARVDALMLEYCPDEMTEEQLENWARHQRPATADVTAAVLAAGSDRCNPKR